MGEKTQGMRGSVDIYKCLIYLSHGQKQKHRKRGKSIGIYGHGRENKPLYRYEYESKLFEYRGVGAANCGPMRKHYIP